MASQNQAVSGRKDWVDIARGFCAMLVILFHEPHTPMLYTVFFAPFIVPPFYLVSGYLTKIKRVSARSYLYKKVCKALIFKLMVAFSLTTLVASKVVGFFLHPSTVPVWLWDTLMTFLIKPRALFFSVLVLCMVYFLVINKCCRDKTLPMLIVSGLLLAVGFLFVRPGLPRPWGWDTALICQFFYTAGYCIRKEKLIKTFPFRWWHSAVSGGLFVAVTVLSAWRLGMEGTLIVMMNNTLPPWPVALLLLTAGNLFMVCFAHIMPRKRLVTRFVAYVGKHSLIYFMCGGPILAYVNYAADLLYGVTHWGILQNHWLMPLVIWLITCLLTLIPCKLSDRWCPALNGRFRMPKRLSIKRHPRAWLGACTACGLIAAGLTAAAWCGLWVPNAIYATQYKPKGVDVSSRQGVIDWHTLASQDISFAYIKATEGSQQVDAQFFANWEGARQMSLDVGAYHFFRFDTPGSTQAKHFIATVPLTDNALPPAVNVELYGDKKQNRPPLEDVHRELHVLLDALEAYYGQKPIIYATETVYNVYIWDEFPDYDIWIRNVVTQTNLEHWNIWQYTDKMKLDGYDGKDQFIDMNVRFS
ncbi:MAG: acyltransferase family protein [Clostridia bacterium]|nr:acyltransferase family protein [Clostridia bacterium]